MNINRKLVSTKTPYAQQNFITVFSEDHSNGIIINNGGFNAPNVCEGKSKQKADHTCMFLK